MSELMNTQEVAAYLRIKERKIYDLVRQEAIPCTRVGGKWLFPKVQIDHWLKLDEPAITAERPVAASLAPRVIAGSHDPLLDWCVTASGCGLALLTGGSLDGLERLASGQAAACGIHVITPNGSSDQGGGYNVAAIQRVLGDLDVVAIEWAWRDQGLITAAGNPLGLAGIGDLVTTKARVAVRPPQSGARVLLDHLLDQAGIAWGDIAVAGPPVNNELEVGLAILDGAADAGVAVRAVARQLRLGFIPLHRERYDLVMRRRDYFEPETQALLAFARTPDAVAKAHDLQGYDVSSFGRVWYNGP
ncbi:DNA-binding protein [Skermanella stibiiresistens SB22]|uniref:DNA-binding protein n=1 Tax=Skermanella stibiiresistens SB22 TaxID=1385369 RepID=W9H781_9PROT|nr:helix-turn-helix transcriptional regulator [Skermanella stibiiresistens]EWY42100.1 DNA-binding protein [Skermanella stibiiresistens SB22]